MSRQQPGFIMVMLLFLLSLAIMLSTQLFNDGMTQTFFARASLERKKARSLAQGGLQLAMSQLSVTLTGSAQQPDQQSRALLEKILPALNRWQTYELQESVEGIDGSIKLCIMCEEGKLNLNRLYDFKEKKFLAEGQPHDTKKLLTSLFAGFKELFGDVDLMTPLEKYLEERGRPLDDVTDLLAIKEFGTTFKNNIFYNPPEVVTATTPKRLVWLLDIFTVDRVTVALQPWVLSDSWCAILGLTRARVDDIKKREQEVKIWLKEFVASAKWVSGDWDKMLKPLYGKEFSTLPKGSEVAFASQFGVQTFSVLSYGSVGAVSQRMYAIIQRQQVAEKGSSPFIIKRVYWL